MGVRWVGFPSSTSGKESACNAGDTRDKRLITGIGRSPAEGNGNPLQYSCLENSMDRGIWQGTVKGVTKSRWLWAHTLAQWWDETFYFLLARGILNCLGREESWRRADQLSANSVNKAVFCYLWTRAIVYFESYVQ